LLNKVIPLLAFSVLLLGSTTLAYAVPDTWTAATTTNNGGNSMFGVSMSDASNGVAVGNSGTMVFTTNGGVDWTAATTTDNDGNRMRGVSMSDASNGVAVGASGTMVFTTSGVQIGGISIPIDQTALLLAGVQSISMWMIPVVISGIGMFLIKRRK